MSWNIFDQSHRITYDTGRADYWQHPPSPSLLNVRQPILDHARELLGQINDFSKDDYLACVYADKTHCHLIQVHNGGQDNKGRPQRSIFLVWAAPLAECTALDLEAWINDPAWPAKESVPLPMPVPSHPYILPSGASPSTLSEKSAEWAEWLANPHRDETGWLVLGAFKGARLIHNALPVRAVPNQIIHQAPPQDSLTDGGGSKSPVFPVTPITGSVSVSLPKFLRHIPIGTRALICYAEVILLILLLLLLLEVVS